MNRTVEDTERIYRDIELFIEDYLTVLVSELDEFHNGKSFPSEGAFITLGEKIKSVGLEASTNLVEKLVNKAMRKRILLGK